MNGERRGMTNRELAEEDTGDREVGWNSFGWRKITVEWSDLRNNNEWMNDGNNNDDNNKTAKPRGKLLYGLNTMETDRHARVAFQFATKRAL
jgi:hypothetical protein